MSDFRTMTPPDGISGVPGWFGKIPSLGDFATRRLPASFVRPWDEWLSSELSKSAEALGPAWSEAYRAGPILCFCLGPGTVNQHAWHGAVVASYDRVGREYPLTLVDAGAPEMGPEAGWTPWVDVARRALAPDCGPDGLDEALAAVHHEDREHESLRAGTSAWWYWSTELSAAARLGIFEGLPRGLYLRILTEQQQRR